MFRIIAVFSFVCLMMFVFSSSNLFAGVSSDASVSVVAVADDPVFPPPFDVIYEIGEEVIVTAVETVIDVIDCGMKRMARDPWGCW